jgi:hypothetical protein
MSMCIWLKKRRVDSMTWRRAICLGKALRLQRNYNFIYFTKPPSEVLLKNEIKNYFKKLRKRHDSKATFI